MDFSLVKERNGFYEKFIWIRNNTASLILTFPCLLNKMLRVKAWDEKISTIFKLFLKLFIISFPVKITKIRKTFYTDRVIIMNHFSVLSGLFQRRLYNNLQKRFFCHTSLTKVDKFDVNSVRFMFWSGELNFVATYKYFTIIQTCQGKDKSTLQ